MEIEDRDRRGGGVTGGEKDTRDEAGGEPGTEGGHWKQRGKRIQKGDCSRRRKKEDGRRGGAEAAGGRPELQKRRIRRRSQGLTA